MTRSSKPFCLISSRLASMHTKWIMPRHYYIYTRPIAEARAVGFEMRRLEMLERELLFINAQL